MRKKQVDPRLGARVAHFRIDRELTQHELADAIGVSETTIQHYEHGRVAIPTDRLQQIARALHCAPADLIPPVGEMKV